MNRPPKVLYQDADELREHLQRLGVTIFVAVPEHIYSRPIDGAEMRTDPADDSVTIVLRGRAAGYLANMLATIPELL